MTPDLLTRFSIPVPGSPATVVFPPVARAALSNGLRIWSVNQASVPVVTFTLVMDGGTASDPADRPGLASLMGSLAAESAGSRDSIELADALARIGGRLDVQPGADATTITLSTLTRHTRAALELMADIVRRPQFTEPDFARVRELRLGRLRQVSRVASTIADRALIAAVFGSHPYGHGALGTTRAVEQTTINDVRALWQSAWSPVRATLVASGEVSADAVRAEVERTFGDWSAGPAAPFITPEPVLQPATAVIAVHRPDAPQAEVRVGHLAGPRRAPGYHALVALNAILGGLFTSRINRNLRERRAITYGARSGFDLRRAGGLFSCDTSVQADAAGTAVTEIIREIREVSVPAAIEDAELDQAIRSLTRGYVRHFETAGQLARALAELAINDLPDDTFDRFVPSIVALTCPDITRAAQAALHPDHAAVAVVLDLEKHRDVLAAIERPIVEATMEF